MGSVPITTTGPPTTLDQVARLFTAAVSNARLSEHVGSPNTIASYEANCAAVIDDQVVGSTTVVVKPSASASVFSVSGEPERVGPYSRMLPLAAWASDGTSSAASASRMVRTARRRTRPVRRRLDNSLPSPRWTAQIRTIRPKG